MHVLWSRLRIMILEWYEGKFVENRGRLEERIKEKAKKGV
jgi:hypothetical protein